MGHQLLWKSHDGSNVTSNLFNNLKDLEIKFDNLVFLPSIESTQNILLSADLFIGDNSSFFIECCVVDTPILFYESGVKFYDNEVYSLYKNASVSFSENKELNNLINTSLENPYVLKKEDRKSVV